jgi:hypothetical protein
VTRLQRYLDYRAICSGDAIKAAGADYQNVARERLIEKTLPEAWRRLVDDEDELLLELIGDRVESLSDYKPDPDVVAAFVRESLHLTASAGAPQAPPPVRPSIPSQRPAPPV